MLSVGEQLETMGLMAAYESAIADYYAACAETFPEQRALFDELVAAEHRHARAIGAFVATVRDGAVHLNADRFRSDAVLAGLDELKGQQDGLRCPNVSLPDVLAACVAIEDGLLEAHCFVTIESDAPALQTLLDCLRLDSEAHRDTLAAALQSVGTAG